ncbi:hypothetical protein M758_3G200400 [Ceratodon purpureus]|nr:hypothetical protein M758_3G200400 [Ceratodon purpureus]
MARRRRRRSKKRRMRHPLYMCMVKAAMCYIKNKKGCTPKAIAKKVAHIYGGRGVNFKYHYERINRAIKRLVRTKCIKRFGSHHYKLVRKCKSDTLKRHRCPKHGHPYRPHAHDGRRRCPDDVGHMKHHSGNHHRRRHHSRRHHRRRHHSRRHHRRRHHSRRHHRRRHHKRRHHRRRHHRRKHRRRRHHRRKHRSRRHHKRRHHRRKRPSRKIPGKIRKLFDYIQ